MTDAANPTIVIPIYEGVTHLDFTGPHQFFTRLPGTKVVVASVGARPVQVDGFSFAGLTDLGAIDHCDVLCVPGGNGCTNAMEDKIYMSAIRGLAAGARYVTSVCTGSLILGAAGLLDGKRAACHWAWRDMLPQFGAIPDGGRVVRDGNIITGGGVTAGIDFALVVIAELAGEEAAQAVQLMLEYEPAPPFRAGRPELAPAAVRELVDARMASAMPARRAAVARAAEAWRRSTMATATA
jgi:transcriptional regulator GlxA family with amidase domain